MKLDNLPQLPERSTLEQLPQTQLVDMLLAQAKVIEELRKEVKRLKTSRLFGQSDFLKASLYRGAEEIRKTQKAI